MEITDTAFTHIAVRRMSSLLLILSTFFDDNGGAGSTQTILSSCDCVLLKDCWIWWLVLVTEDSVYGCPRESRLPSKLPASVSKTPKWILPFLFLSKVFYTRLELYLAVGMDRIN